MFQFKISTNKHITSQKMDNAPEEKKEGGGTNSSSAFG